MELSDASAIYPEFTIPDITRDEALSFKLTVTDNLNQTISSTKNVSAAVPLSVSANYTATNLVAAFSAQTTGGFGDYTYSWEFGDGSTSVSESPSYTYDSAGSYQVSLTVTDSKSNQSVSKTLPVTVQEQKASSGGGSFGWVLLFVLAVASRRIW